MFNDWIISAKFIPHSNYEKLYVLFAHNNLYLYNTLTMEYTNIWCEEKCLLYCGNISTDQPNQAVIFSGTVFQEILIWIIVQDNLSLQSDQPVLWRLKGHDGVIFSIFYDSCKNLITSTSDDRTVRLWEIKSCTDESLVYNNWKDIKINLKHTMYGHTARVWKSIIVNNTIISIGEDSQVCIWSMDGNLCDKILAHNGATIWSIEVSNDNCYVFTGGADDGVYSWSLLSNQMEMSLMSALELEEKKIPKYVQYLKSGKILIFVENGELFTYNAALKELIKNHINLSKYKNYCLMQICPNRTKIVFASNDGHLDIFEEVNDKLDVHITSTKIFESKIFAVHWLNDNTLLVCGHEGHLKMFQITNDRELLLKSEFMLPMSKERWTTTAIMLKNLLICGDRNGHIYVFKINSEKDKKNPLQYLTKMHYVLGIQYFHFINKKLISAGRDGTLRFYKVNFSDNTPKIIQPLYYKKVPMTWVSKIVQTEQDVYVLGFKEIEFMIYSINSQRLILKFICGGGHRSWDCTFIDKFIQFTCIRNKKVYTTNNMMCTFSKTIIQGHHTKEINCMQVLPGISNKNILLSASEDCTLRFTELYKILPEKYQLSCLDLIDGHISSVKCINIINLNSSNEKAGSLIFTGGGRAQLKVWKVTVDVVEDKFIKDNLEITELMSYMLHGTNKDQRKIMLSKQQEYFIDPETRFMDITSYTYVEKNIVILFVACSDGFIRIFSYDIYLNNFYLTTEIPYYNRCIIKIHVFDYGNEVILISMATDGIVNLWSMKLIIENICNKSDNVNIKPFKSWNIHQSGINSYDFKQNSEVFLLLTGGDDNKINLSLFTIFESTNTTLMADILAEWSSSFIHYTQITGIKFYGIDKFVSVAIDQQIVTYYYSYCKSILSVEPLQKVLLTSITDPHGLTIVNSLNNDTNDVLVCIYGQGIEIIRLEMED
ncbi:WD repeat-containing protein 6 isoform X2 [Chelonus insularis]|nr:WD repeat-containing protein 6 isoform X2 [Chelonus insularis]